MSAIAQDLERRLIPRWRFSNTKHMCSLELASDPRNKRQDVLNKSFLNEKLFEWANSRSMGTAVDLVSCGISGRWIDEIKPAAEYLLENEPQLPPQVAALASRAIALSESNEDSGFDVVSSLPEITFELACRRVAITRQRLYREPRNVLAWLDLGLAYANLGETQKSTICMERALYLAPTNRQVIRSAVRLFIHTGEYDRAHKLLLRNPRTKVDPWLIASEVAVAKIAKQNPRFVRQGRSILEKSGFSPGHLSELHSALGTADFYGGSNRKAKQHFRKSLVSPTDNVLAQARWVRSQMSGIDIDDRAFELPLGFEARTWKALEESRWNDAGNECSKWLRDEPYSSRPATTGSYIGISLTNDFAGAEKFARLGLRADPEDQMLRNNLTVSLAYQGKLVEAMKEFSNILAPLNSDFPKYVFAATAGLLQFRLGKIEDGREMYNKARELAPTSKKHRVDIFHAREEINANTPEANEYLEKALSHKVQESIQDTSRLQLLLKQQSEGTKLNEFSLLERKVTGD